MVRCVEVVMEMILASLVIDGRLSSRSVADALMHFAGDRVRVA